MWMTDAEGDVTFVNEGWLRFTGRDLAEDLGDTFGMQRAPRRPRRPAGALARRVRPAHRVPLRVPADARAAASTAGCSRWASPRFSGGEFAGYVGTATDIHERKQMEDALR